MRMATVRAWAAKGPDQPFEPYACDPGPFGAGQAKVAAGERLHSAIRPCSLGWTLVATSDRGVCAIIFGDAPEALREELRRRFPGAAVVEDARQGNAIDAAAFALVESPAMPVSFPVDPRGTAFQQRVWAALRAIPPGATASYGDIARRIGAPAATRAVAGACAANPVAVAIPCHRVLRADGSISGYRWGVERKRTLLARESATALKA